MARTSGQLAIAHGPQFAAERLLGDREAELLPEPLHQIDQAPAHDTMDRRDRAFIELCGQSRAMRVGELGRPAGRLAVEKALRPVRVELHHPVAHDLQRDPADPSGFGPARPVLDRRQSQETPRLWAILALAGHRAKAIGVEVAPKRNRHGEPPSFATLNQTRPKPTRPKRVTPSGTWYNISG